MARKSPNKRKVEVSKQSHVATKYFATKLTIIKL